MKKFLVSLFLSFTLFSFSTKTTDAGCSPQAGGTTCNRVSCGIRYCCDTSIDCDQFKAQIPPSNSINGQSGGASSELTCDGGNGIQTAIGCINVLTNDGGTAFLGQLLQWSVGVGGGIAFLLILYAGFMVMSSAGNPERLKAGQELLTSAISGLILLIFSIFILKFIGVDILGLGAFGFGKTN